jgi:retron-type reverse transcriptase
MSKHFDTLLSPLLSNIMLHEFDAWLEAKYLSDKARKDRWASNFGIKLGRPITVRENRQWKPAVAYCRYADCSKRVAAWHSGRSI